MLLIRCPYCEEERPELEFRHAGEAHIARPENITAISDDDFEAFFFIRTNPKGIIYERWRHVHGCGRFFNAVRDTVTDRFFTTYKAGLPKPPPERFARAAAALEPEAATAEIPVVEARQRGKGRTATRSAEVSAAGGSQPPSSRDGRRATPPSNAAAPAAEPKTRRKASSVPEPEGHDIEKKAPRRRARKSQTNEGEA